MAKRIKVKGKAPRGLSKAQRIKISSLAQKRNKIVNAERKRVDPGDVSESTLDAIDRYDYLIDEIAERPDISSGASSTRKKRVKEGNRKFIGPRQLRSELAEDREAKVRSAEGFPVKYITNRRGPGRAGHIYEVDEGGIWPFEASKQEIRKYDRLRKESNPSSKRRARELLRSFFARYYGGGQEFDAQD